MAENLVASGVANAGVADAGVNDKAVQLRQIDPDAVDYADWAQLNAVSGIAVESGVVENLQAGWDNFWAEDATTASLQLENGSWFDGSREWFTTLEESHKMSRTNQIQSLIREGKLPVNIYDMARVEVRGAGEIINYNEVANYVNDNNLLDGQRIATDQDFFARRREAFLSDKKIRDDIRERSTFTGDIAAFLGGVGGAVIDPINLAIVPLTVPLTGLVATSRVAYASSMALREAALSFGAQGIVEPFMHDWREKLGIEYTWQDSLLNMTAAGVVGGTLGAAVGTFVYKFTSTGFQSTDYDQLYKEFRKAGFMDDEAATLANQKREFNLRDLLAPAVDDRTFVTNSETRHEQLNAEGPRLADRVGVEHETNDEALMAQMYDAVDDNLPFYFGDDSVVPIKQLVADEEAALSRVNAMRVCLNG